ncbi:F-box and WD domain protein [Entamoeba marina]
MHNDIIQDFFSQSNSTNWSIIPPHIIPPLFCMETKAIQTQTDFIAQTQAVFPFNFTLFHEKFLNISTFIASFSNISNVRNVTSQSFQADAFMPTTRRLESIQFHYIITTINSNMFIIVLYGINPPVWNRIYYYAERKPIGMEFTTQSWLNLIGTPLKNPQTVCVTATRKSIQQVYNYYKQSPTSRMLIEGERTFYNYIGKPKRDFPVVIFRCKFFRIVARYDYSAILIEGSVHYRTEFKKMMGILYDLIQYELMFTKKKKIVKVNEFEITHKESPFFGKELIKCDVMYGSSVVDGTVFCYTTSTHSPQCERCDHKKGDPILFDYVHGGLLAELTGNMASVVYCNHFFTPQFTTLSPKERSVFFSTIISSSIIINLKIQYNIQPPFNHFSSGLVPSNVIILLNSIMIKEKFINEYSNTRITSQQNSFDFQNPILKKIISLATMKTVTFNDLKDSQILSVATTLHYSDIISLTQCNKRLYSLLMNNQEFWKGIYQKFYDIQVFNSYSTIAIKPIESYFKRVQYYAHQRSRINKCKYIPTQTKVFDSTVKYLTTFNDQIICSDLTGNCVIVDTYPHNASDFNDTSNKTFLIQNDVVVGMRSYNDNLWIGTKSGNINIFANSNEGTGLLTSKQYNISPQQGIEFLNNTDKIICWNKGVSIHDLNCCKDSFFYVPHKQPINEVHEMWNSLILTSSVDKTLKCFDTKSKAFSFVLENQANILSFDTFDNYIVSAGSDRCLRLWDIRFPELLMSRTIHVNSVNSVKCGNCFMISGGGDKIVNRMHCRKGWMGKFFFLYRHNSPVTVVNITEDMLLSGSADGCVYYTEI